MTPTMKLKRKVIEQNYSGVIESFYEESLAESV
jgi:long-subunit acyl-CoA synthetase (AMP-forming)